MSFWKIIKGLNFKQLSSLFVQFLKHPLYMISTASATIETFRISQKEYPDIHGKLNKANAFRHALWNILIAKKCMKFSSDLDSVIQWTKRITDWHEEFSPNEKLAEVMDLHNNKIGRVLFEKYLVEDTKEYVSLLKKELENAKQILFVEDVEKFSNQLVYIEN